MKKSLLLILILYFTQLAVLAENIKKPRVIVIVDSVTY